ncbi:hypothetical protein ACJJTC_009551 [Scirpophaga incertulas]
MASGLIQFAFVLASGIINIMPNEVGAGQLVKYIVGYLKLSLVRNVMGDHYYVFRHFLYLPMDPTMENMVVKSPPFRGLWEFCKFEVKLHQSKMQNASIRLISESTISEVQWILQEVAGNNFEEWYPMQFMIGKVMQEVRIMLEIVRPTYVSLSHPLPHIAIDNIRMVECLPEPPVFNGECLAGQLKCNIMNKDSCIKLQQVCDLVRDCDDGTDESQNCDKMPYGSYCNFEQDNCGFENVPQPILKWSRHNGPTPHRQNGPQLRPHVRPS